MHAALYAKYAEVYIFVYFAFMFTSSDQFVDDLTAPAVAFLAREENHTQCLSKLLLTIITIILSFQNQHQHSPPAGRRRTSGRRPGAKLFSVKSVSTCFNYPQLSIKLAASSK